MYEQHYRLSRRPFLTLPDPDFLFWSHNHSLAFAMLRYALMGGVGITVITGEIGAGKTTLLRQMLRETPDEVVIGLLSNMQAGRGELIHWVMTALGLEIGDEGHVRLFRRLQSFLVDAYAEGRRVVLVIDEAQNLDVDTLEELRMLSNINADGHELLQIVLVGQPQLRSALARPELAQFVQRIGADFHLTPLDANETVRYIERRLALADAQWRIFPTSTCRLIHQATGGVPRLINILCDLCLIYGFAAETKVIEEDLLREFLSAAHERGIYRQFLPLQDFPRSLQQVR